MTDTLAPAFELEDATVTTAARPILDGLRMWIADGAVTAVLGPGGVGKSLLLRGLTGEPMPGGVRVEGRWLHRGKRIARSMAGGSRTRSIAWVPQRPSSTVSVGTPSWQDALDGRCATVLLDEPEVGLGPDERERLIERLRAHRKRGAAVVVTHDVAFAESVSDCVCLLVAGRLEAFASTREFFERPPSELARRFLDQGNCWLPGPRPPELPSHFRWVLPGKLAGMGKPGLLGDEQTDLEAVASAGVEVLVSLTTQPIGSDRLQPFGMRGRHFPIPDMGAPAVAAAARLCRDVERSLDRGAAVALHCHAGLGRTGTMLASYLVWSGATPEEAVRTVRQACAQYIQSDAQLKFLRRFSEQV
ncbi:MAG: ATP-binding cassette domain-containing protein [Myxococcota bacterium]